MGDAQLTTQVLAPEAPWVVIVPAAPPTTPSVALPVGTAAPVGTTGSAVPESPVARTTEFRAVEGGNEMQSGTALMTEAYAAIWLCTFALVLAGVRKMKKLEARLEGLADEIARARERDAKPRS